MKIYVDANATTAMLPEVVETMWHALGDEGVGNPSSLHWAGRAARKAVEEARGRVATLIGASPSEIVFTSGGTEANNLALRGVVGELAERAWRGSTGRGKESRDAFSSIESGVFDASKERNERKAETAGAASASPVVVTSTVEHPSVLEPIADLERGGMKAIRVEVDTDGLVDGARFVAAAPPGTLLATLMRANNETGNLMPVRDVTWRLKERGVTVHCDAVQAVGRIPVDVNDLGVDLLSLSAHKFHGPKGVGALYVRKGTALMRTIAGGPQEQLRRAGTENVLGIIGMGYAAEMAAHGQKTRAMAVTALRDRFEREIFARIPGVRLNGHRLGRVPGTLNVSFDGVDGEAVLIALDLEGVAASSGAACASGTARASHVLIAMGRSTHEARSSVRFSFTAQNTDAEVSRLIELLPPIVERVRREDGRH